MIVEEVIALALLRKSRAPQEPMLSWRRAKEKGGNGRREGGVVGLKRREGGIVVVMGGYS